MMCDGCGEQDIPVKLVIGGYCCRSCACNNELWDALPKPQDAEMVDDLD
jgi:hypothetical protein